MLTESIVVSSLRPEKIPSHLQNKDVGVYLYDLNPSVSLKASLKKSSTDRNCLAANQTHIFAAQADKAAIHVYNLSKGNQECLVPFREKITSLALVGGYYDAGILALGTEGGNVIFWELATGRQLSTGAAHLQSISCMAVDPAQNFLITGSPDSTVLVWSIPTCLSFASVENPYSDQSSPFAPLHSLTNHRASVTCLATGHSRYSSDFAISGSEDKSCLLWDYRTGKLLRTFLLTFVPRCLAVDPGDRAFYIGATGGAIQFVDIYKYSQLGRSSSNGSEAAAEPDPADNWRHETDLGDVLTIALSYDGTQVLSGHQNGQLYSWAVGTGRATKVAEVVGPLTNLVTQPIRGLVSSAQSEVRTISVVKPKHEIVSTSPNELVGRVAEGYTFSTQFQRPLRPAWGHQVSRNCRSRGVADDLLMGDFDEALSHVALPAENMEEGVASVLGPDLTVHTSAAGVPGKVEQDVKKLQALLETSSKSYMAMKNKVDQLTKEVLQLRQDERDRLQQQRLLQARRLQVFSDANQPDMDPNSGSASDEDTRRG